MLEHFRKQGKASFVMDGQWGSAGKGAAVAFMTTHMATRGEAFDIVTTNNGAQSGHTSVHQSMTKVQYHLPTAAVWTKPGRTLTYLNGGAVINVDVLLQELIDNAHIESTLSIHPNAAIITQDCRDAEMRDDSAQTKIAGTRKGVGEALARKVLRSGMLAKDEPRLARWIKRIDLNEKMLRGASVLVEVPQGHSLSLDGPFYPHVTSRNCTVMQAMSDAGIHPCFYHQSMMVIRTYPIRVGSLSVENHSGGHFPDQQEITWSDLSVKAEVTTVTKRVRRVYTFSEQQVAEAIAQTRPAVIFLSFCDYLADPGLVNVMIDRVRNMCNKVGSICHDGPEIVCGWGPSTADVRPA